MDSELFLNLCNLSWEDALIAFIVFGLTMLIKWPIKKATSKLEENKRKAVNTVIVFIPMILSILLNGLYYGIFKHEWFAGIVFESAGSIYILALAIYAIYSIVELGVESNGDTITLSQPITNFKFIWIINYSTSGAFRCPFLFPAVWLSQRYGQEIQLESYDGSRYRCKFDSSTSFTIVAKYYANDVHIYGIN